MIIGTGIDIIEIDRFKMWRNYARKQLRHVFSEQEINFCLSNEIKSAERFAVRFAAREAFFKALSMSPQNHQKPFLQVCKHVVVMRDEKGICSLHVDWHALNLSCLASSKIHVSLSHNHTQAVAMVILEQ